MSRFYYDENGCLWDEWDLSTPVMPQNCDWGLELTVHQLIFNNIQGDVLIAGLGTGFVLPHIVDKVETIDVVEKHIDVITLFTTNHPDRMPLITNLYNEDIHYFTSYGGKKYDRILWDLWCPPQEDQEYKDLGITTETTITQLKQYLKEDNDDYFWIWEMP